MSRAFRCSPAARWLPRTLAAATVAAALLAGFGLDQAVPGVSTFRILLAVAGVLIALWVVRAGSDVHREARLRHGRLELSRGGRAVQAVPLAELMELDWEPPLSAARRWLPALVLRDRTGREWRVPAVLADGGRFVAELVAASGREELANWSLARGLERRMGRAAITVAAGYSVAAALVAAGLMLLR